MKHIAVIVLAAGQGTRIKASHSRNKVDYKLAGQPMISYSVDLFEKLGIREIIVVVGYAQASVRRALGKRVKFAVQKKQLGTADALKAGIKKAPASAKDIISVYGDDSAFYTPELIKALIKKHRSAQADITFATINLKNPTGLGRIVRNNQGKVTAIVEEKNATEEQKNITEINTGLYIFNRQFLDKSLDKIKINSISGEYYLTDLIEIASSGNYKVQALKWTDASIWFGVNTKAQLEKAKHLKRQKKYAI